MNNFAAAIIVIFLAAAAAAGALYVYEYQPLAEEKQGILNKIEEGRKLINQLKSKEKEVVELKAKIKTLEAKEKKLQTESISLQDVVPKLLDSTELIANKFKVKFQDIRISQLIRAEEWSELPVEITLLGTFKNIGNFMYVVEKRKLLNLAAGSMNVSVSADVDPETKSPKLSVVLSAKVYIP